MAENIVNELRKLLLEIIVPDLKMLLAKMDDLQQQLELSRKSTQERLDAIEIEVAAMRGEMRAFRGEMETYRIERRNRLGLHLDDDSSEHSLNDEEQTLLANSGTKRRVN